MTEIHRRDSPDYRDMRSEDQRIMISPHVEVQTDGLRRAIFPASGVTFGQVRTTEQTDYQMSITVYALVGASGLMFIPTVEEMEALGEEMLRHAKRIRDAASRAADEAIERARR